jgi:type I restriction enzyme S subunit
MLEDTLVKFGDICREVKLSSKNPLDDGFERYIGLEHLDSNSLKVNRWGDLKEESPSFTRVFKKGHILFGKRRPYLKKAAIAEFDGVCSGDIIVMEAKKESVIPDLLPFIIQSDSFWNWAIKTSSGSLSPRTKFKSIAEYTFNLPIDKAQEKLLSMLNKGQEIEVNYVESMELLNELYELVLRNSLYNLDKQKIFNADKSNIKSNIADVTLNDVLLKIIDCEHKTAPYSESETEYLVVRTNNVKNGSLYFEEMKYTNRASFEAWTQRMVPQAGDIIFTREAPAGDSCLIPADLKVCLGQRTVLLVPNKEKVLPEFLSRYLASRFARHFIEKYIVGTTVERINIADIPRVRFLLPDIQTQQLIMNVFSNLEELISLKKYSRKQVKDISKSLIKAKE